MTSFLRWAPYGARKVSSSDDACLCLLQLKGPSIIERGHTTDVIEIICAATTHVPLFGGCFRKSLVIVLVMVFVFVSGALQAICVTPYSNSFFFFLLFQFICVYTLLNFVCALF